MAKPKRKRTTAEQERHEWAACLCPFLRRLARDPDATWEVWEPVFKAAEGTASLLRKNRDTKEASDWLRRQLATLDVTQEKEQWRPTGDDTSSRL